MSYPPPPPPPPSDGGIPPPPGGAAPPPAPGWSGPAWQPEPQPQRSGKLPWIVLLLVLLAGGAGTVGYLLVSAGDGEDGAAAPASTTAATTPEDGSVTAPPDQGAGSTIADSLPSGSSRIDPAIGWRRVDPSQFGSSGGQQMNDVVVLGGRLVAGGSTTTYQQPDASVPIPAGGGPVTVDEWEITVVEVNLDGKDLIAAGEFGRDRLTDEFRAVVLTLDVANLAEEARRVSSAFSTRLWRADGSPLREGYCGTVADALGGELEPGARTTGTVCRAVAAAAVGEGLSVGFSPRGAPFEEQDAAVWLSDDGEVWTPVEDSDLGGPRRQMITRLAVFGDTLYAIGRDTDDDHDGALWRSEDGTSWERIEVAAFGGPGDQLLSDIVAVGEQLMVTGSTQLPVPLGESTETWDIDRFEWMMRDVDARRGRVWASADGLSWDVVPMGRAGSGFGHVDTLLTSHDGLTAVGIHLDGDPMMLRSGGDVGSWAETGFAAMNPWRFAAAAVAGDRAYLLGSATVSSIDGVTWEVAGVSTMTDAVGFEGGILGVGWSGTWDMAGPVPVDGRVPCLQIVDAAGHAAVARKPGLVADGEHGAMSGVAAWEERFVAVGTTTTSGGEHAAVWIGGALDGSVEADLVPLEPEQSDPLGAAPSEPRSDIVRYDGSWEVIHRGDDLGDAELIRELPPLFAGLLAVDGDGVVWVGSSEWGMYAFDGAGWTNYGRAEGLPSRQIIDLEVTGGGTIWAGTPAGPAYFDGSVWIAPELPDDIGLPHVTGIAAAPDDSVWVAMIGGLARWAGSEWTVFTMANGLPSAVLRDVQASATGVWAVTWAGVCYWDGFGWRSFTDAPFRYHPGFAMASRLDDSLYFFPEGIEGDDRGGIVRLAPDGTMQPVLDSNSITAVGEAPDGTLYVATALDGFYAIDGGVRLIEAVDGVELTMALYIGEMWLAPDGEIWMGSGIGLLQAGGADAIERHVEVPGLGYPLSGHARSFSTGAARQLAFGPDGSVWALTREQLPEWPPQDE